MTTTDEAVPVPAPGSRQQPLGPVGALVARRATVLQTLLLGSRKQQAAFALAKLAQLRANVGKEPGTDPLVWDMTVEGVPGEPRGDDATHEERAVHAALVLFAVHQQSRSTGMHQPGVGLGRAVARLERVHGGSDSDRTSSVRRRFDAVVTSDGLAEVLQHLRGITTQLRSESIGLDYGMLADDLDRFQQPGGADVVRRRWARQLYRLEPDPVDGADAPPTTSSVSPDPTTEEQQ